MVLLPFFLTTVSLTTCQVQVVPSAALITTSLPLTDVIVPRSNESVWNPVLLWKVAVPSTPPRWRSRRSAQRTRAGGIAGLPAASLSAVFSWARRSGSTLIWRRLRSVFARYPIPKPVGASPCSVRLYSGNDPSDCWSER